MSWRNNDLIRPLLQTDKEELLDWLQERGIDYCLDSSNEDIKFLRNRVRKELLPFMEEQFGAGVRKSLRKTADILAEDEQLLADLTDDACAQVIRKAKQTSAGYESLMILRTPFCRLHRALQRRVVEQMLWKMGSKASYNHILLIVEAAVSGRTHSELHLSQGLRIGVFREYLELSYPKGRTSWRGRLFSE